MISLCEPAKYSPCADCKYREFDKMLFKGCIECNKRIQYDLSIFEPRMLQRELEIINSDAERWEQIKDINLFVKMKSPKRKKKEIEENLLEQAMNAGHRDILEWLLFLYNEEQLTLMKIAKIAGVSTGKIRRLLKNKTRKQGAIPKEVKNKCNVCGKLIIRGKNVTHKMHLKRKYCSQECFREFKRCNYKHPIT